MHETRYVTSQGSALALAAADVEAAFLGRHQHIFVWRQFGGGSTISFTGQAVRYRPSSLRSHAGLTAADSHASNEKSPFLIKIVKKKKGVIMLKL